MTHNYPTETEGAPRPNNLGRQGIFTGATAIVLYIAAASFLAHMLTAGRYGYFRDELYYLACARHPPPLRGTITRGRNPPQRIFGLVPASFIRVM